MFQQEMTKLLERQEAASKLMESQAESLEQLQKVLSDARMIDEEARILHREEERVRSAAAEALSQQRVEEGAAKMEARRLQMSGGLERRAAGP